jgi:hypothetical protein
VKIKLEEIIAHRSDLIILIIIGKGRRIAISTSKIKKIIVIIKNRRENGIREDEKGSNPHSKGEDFSRSSCLFFLIIEANLMINNEIMVIKKMIKIRDKIISFMG